MPDARCTRDLVRDKTSENRKLFAPGPTVPRNLIPARRAAIPEWGLSPQHEDYILGLK